MNLKTFCNDHKAFNDFIEELDSRISNHYAAMLLATDVHEIYRHQGAIKELNNLKKLRDKVNA